MGKRLMLPGKIFITGAPGSLWNGVTQALENNLSEINTSDRNNNRVFNHHGGIANATGGSNIGAYFGTGCEFNCDLNEANLREPYANTDGTLVLKSHDWAFKLAEIKQTYPNAWIILCMRDTLKCYNWWLHGGGLSISYPDYSKYLSNENMKEYISSTNKLLMDFACTHNLTWQHPTSSWFEQQFGVALNSMKPPNEFLVTIYKALQ
jgi:hypothetical protein